MIEQPKWVIEYIEMCANLSDKKTIDEMSKVLKVTRDAIYKYLQRHPEVPREIHQRLKNQRFVVGNKAFKRLCDIIGTTKNPKLIQIALEMGELYTQKQEVTNKYDDMEDKDLDKQLQNILNKAKNQRQIETTEDTESINATQNESA